MKCFKCGTLIENDVESCPNCNQSFRKIKKEFSPNIYNKIKSLSENKPQENIPLEILIGDSISEQYIINDYLGDDLIFYSFIGIDSFNKQKVQIDFIKPTLLKTEHEKSQFINSLREEKFRQHENLTIIYDYGKHNSNYYIVSEYIDGITLRQIIDAKQENFTLEEVEPIITQITDALTDIHEDSLIGYLIPENIIIMKDILKIRNTFWFRCFDHKNVLKYFSSDLPSYHYLAPELRGGSPKLINATDLYSLGVILSALLTGKIYKGVSYNLTEYNEELPFEIDNLFIKLINKNANKRFQNVEDFLINFDKLFTYTSVSQDETTRVVNTSDFLEVEEQSFDFEDEMETSMIDKNETQSIIKSFEEDEPETLVMPKKTTNKKQTSKKEVFEDDEHQTKIMPKKEKEKNIEKTIPVKKEAPIETKKDEPTEEKEAKESNTSYHTYKNPFYEPDKFDKEQEHFKQQQEFQEYQKSVYQQLSDFQQKDNKKNIFMLIGFFSFLIIIVIMFFVMYLQKNNNVSKADKNLIAKLELLDKELKLIKEEKEKLEKEKNKTSKDVLIASKEREDKENEIKKNDEKLKELEDKKKNEKNLEEKKRLEEEEKKQKLENERLQKELEEKKKREEEKRKKEKEANEKLKKEKKRLALMESKAKNTKKIETKKIKNKKLIKKIEEDKKKKAELVAKRKVELERKKEEALAKKKEKERLAKEKKQKSLDAEADALLAAVQNETKKEVVSNIDAKCPSGMVKIKAGTFSYGTTASDPTRGPNDPLLKTVNLNTFCIDRFEYRGPVNFNQAEAKCKKKGKRLCSTQEWEKACKGKYNRRFPYGKKFNADKCNTANADGDARSYKPTGSYKRCKSPYGLYDMSGNLAEWTKNGNSSKQILKGGSYTSEDFDAKCSSVKKASKGSRKSTYGYRCCKDL